MCVDEQAMSLKTNIDQFKQWAHQPTHAFGLGGRSVSLLYWLAGARKATLDHVPESERERIAVIGSSVMIPTLLAFFGMYLYASSRFQTPRPILTLFIALMWAFVILHVDRILLATYRPFQPMRRKVVQVCFRVGLAAVISVAIAFPFCLDQYRGAIGERLQGEYRARLHSLMITERTEREAMAGRDAAVLADLRGRLDKELAAGPVDPHLFVEELATHTARGREDTTREYKRQLDQEAATALGEWQAISAQMREVEQDLKAEEWGRLPVERGGTGKSGQGAKHKELARSLEMLAKTEQAARQRYEGLVARSAAIQPAAPPKDVLSTLPPERQAALQAEATGRAERIDRLVQAVAKAEADQAEHLAAHKLRFDPQLKSYRDKIEGRFDPMEETIGLFKVIFVPESGGDGPDSPVNRYKWIAALFQFSIVFGTLFLLDLIAILSKVMSRPGPYDVLVEFPELVAGRNLEALRQDYPRHATAWAEGGAPASSPSADRRSVDLRDTGEMARLLLSAHLPPMGSDREPKPPAKG